MQEDDISSLQAGIASLDIDKYTPANLEGAFPMNQIYEGGMPKTTFNHDAIEGTISTVRNNIEVALLLEGSEFQEREGRATAIVFEPLEGVKLEFEQYLIDIEHYAAPAKFFHTKTVPAIKCIYMDNDKGKFTPHNFVRQLRKTLKGNGNIAINDQYVAQFDTLKTWLAQSVTDLRNLANLLVLVIKEGNGPDPGIITNPTEESATTTTHGIPTIEKKSKSADDKDDDDFGFGKLKGWAMNKNFDLGGEDSKPTTSKSGGKKSDPIASNPHPWFQEFTFPPLTKPVNETSSKSSVSGIVKKSKDDEEFGFDKLKGWAMNKTFDLGGDDRDAATSKSSSSSVSQGDGKKASTKSSKPLPTSDAGKSSSSKPSSSKPMKLSPNPLVANLQTLLAKMKADDAAEEAAAAAAATTEKIDFIKATNIAAVKTQRELNPDAPESPYELAIRMAADPATPKWKKLLADKYPIYKLSVHPAEEHVYSKALMHTIAAIKQGELCAKTIESRKKLAENMRVVYGGMEAEVDEVENDVMDVEEGESY
ncbi:hypothetical protein N7G274_006263 [Stereocaulon virgatum]|uniref:Uncharacterized protein n=1 Tax=Stereocaulon virgatum TaxID=373712 RepID=A0ABR4A4P7_9LECA